METCLSYTDSKTAYFSTDEKKLIKKIYKFKKENPEDIEIIKEPSENDGCMYAQIPVKYFKLSCPRKRTFTKEQLEAARERGRKIAERHKELAKKHDD